MAKMQYLVPPKKSSLPQGFPSGSVNNMPPVNASKMPKGTTFGAPNKLGSKVRKKIKSKGFMTNYSK